LLDDYAVILPGKCNPINILSAYYYENQDPAISTDIVFFSERCAGTGRRGRECYA
jgi:hypothetical protein